MQSKIYATVVSKLLNCLNPKTAIGLSGHPESDPQDCCCLIGIQDRTSALLPDPKIAIGYSGVRTYLAGFLRLPLAVQNRRSWKPKTVIGYSGSPVLHAKAAIGRMSSRHIYGY